MTAGDWDDLERVWQSLPAQAAPAAEELRRQQRWRWLSTFILSTEIVTGVLGAAAGVWVLTRGDFVSVVMGVATLVFVAAVSASSWWARSLAPVRHDDPVMSAVEAALRRARLGVRLAFATLWSTAAALVFLAVIAFALSLGDRPGGYFMIGIALVWLAAWQLGTIVYLRKRSADLARLRAVKADLESEGLMSGSGVR